MEDVRLAEHDRDVAVGMRRTVIFHGERLAVQLERMLLGEDVLGHAALLQRNEIVIPVLHPLNLRQVLAGVLVRDDLGSARTDPGVAIGVIEMPVGIDEMGHGLGGERGERLASSGGATR